MNIHVAMNMFTVLEDECSRVSCWQEAAAGSVLEAAADFSRGVAPSHSHPQCRRDPVSLLRTSATLVGVQ